MPVVVKLPLKASHIQRLRGLAVLACYGLAFHFSHLLSAIWGGDQYYSLWYPAAGMRLAFLWHFGARWTPAVIIAEVLVQLASGIIAAGSPDMLHQALGVARAPLCYGLVVWGVRQIEQRRASDLATPPMPFAIAAVLAPIAGAAVSVMSDALWPGRFHALATVPISTVATAFLVGDLLGVLLLAPALIWLPTAFRNERSPRHLPIKRAMEAIVVLIIGWVLALMMMKEMGAGIFLMPILLSTSWAGLRCGRGMAWVAIIIAAAVALRMSGETTETITQLNIHMSLATIAITAYLAGSFADAQDQARRDIARRDRILFQAERLKTLRAMSVAVIHEISQPLSTLAIESRHLEELSADPHNHDDEIRQSAALIARKTAALADMVRRLRQFGGRAVDEPSMLSINAILASAVNLANAELKQGNIGIRASGTTDNFFTLGQETELTQALLNILRNAVAASPGKAVSATVEKRGAEIVIIISNRPAVGARDYAGMGIGSIVARTIIEAHGGRLARSDKSGLVVHEIFLPMQEPTDA